MDKLKSRYKYLNTVNIPGYKGVTPNLLTGADNLMLSVASQTLEAALNEPIASRTRLGWVVGGPTSNKTTIDSNYNFHHCECSSDEHIHELIKNYFSIDNFGVKITSTYIK